MGIERVASRASVLIDPWRAHPLAWIHRVEASAIVRELRASNRVVDVNVFDRARLPSAAPILLRLSDPVMLEAAHALTAASVVYRGPSAEALAHCYDKWSAYEVVAANGIDCPETRPANEADTLIRPLVLKPRRGSDSIELHVLRAGAVPLRLQNERTLAQRQIIGTELTVGVIDGIAGRALRILLPEGVPYTFLRKYLPWTRREVVTESALAERVRNEALKIVSVLGANWAVRVDFILERVTGRLIFLECDAAPLVGPASAFAASLAAIGLKRDVQLSRLLGEA